MEQLDPQTLYSLFRDDLITYAPKLAFALGFMVVGWFSVGFVVRGVNALFDKTDFDEALERFLASVISIGLKVILVITAAGIAGVETTSLVALLGAAGLAVGLALQGSLSNFAGGVLILIFKPFRIGDYISAQGTEGTVRKIEIFSTTLASTDNKKIVLPNGALANDVIINYTGRDTRRIDLTVGIDYGDSIQKAREAAYAVIKAEGRVLHDPEPQVVVESLGDSSVNIQLRVWVNTSEYLATKFALTEAVKLAFDEAGISIPFPQRVVHMHEVAPQKITRKK